MEKLIKCVIWDLDDTVWHGTLAAGDDITLRPGIADTIRELDRRGILQSIASKNEYGQAWRKIQAYALGEYFLHPQICWGNKSDSIRQIASKLCIGIEAFALVDDQQFELDEVRFSLPEVSTYHASQIDSLLTLPEFHTSKADPSGRLRRQIYQTDIQRENDKQQFNGPPEEFLATLGTKLTIRPASLLDLDRAEELMRRTNQLNTNGHTYSKAELKAFQRSSHHLLAIAELDDRYGSSGIIGFALVDQAHSVWLLKQLLISCRVITRGVGGVILSCLLQLARKNNARVRTEFIPNNRNRMMYVTYRFYGFREIGQYGDCLLLEHSGNKIRAIPQFVSVVNQCLR